MGLQIGDAKRLGEAVPMSRPNAQGTLANTSVGAHKMDEPFHLFLTWGRSWHTPSNTSAAMPMDSPSVGYGWTYCMC